MWKIATMFLIGLGAGLWFWSRSETDTTAGRFEGDVRVTWLEDGRTMRLESDFVYIDPDGKRWEAPAGSVVDGASIPGWLWTGVGSPFVGKYRNASVVHDIACNDMSESWEDVHWMFREACRCGGVEEPRLSLMYWAVHNYGPQWREVNSIAFSTSTPGDAPQEVKTARPVRHDPMPADEETMVRAMEYFKANARPHTREELESLEFSQSAP